MRRDFYILMSGRLVSIVGDGLAAVAILWWVLQATGSAAIMGSVAAVMALVSVLVSPFAGVFVDRLDRRRLMMGVDLVRAGCYAVLALLAAGGHVPLLPVILLLVLVRAGGGLFGPAVMAVLPLLVSDEDLQRANGVQTFAESGGQIVGAAIGGALVAAFGPGVALGADAASFLVSVASLALIRIPAAVPAAADGAGAPVAAAAEPRAEAAAAPTRAEAAAAEPAGRPARSSFGTDLRAGLAYVRGDGLLVSLLGPSLAANAMLNAVDVLLPVLAAGPLHAGARGYGLLEAAFPVGMVIGAAGIGVLGRMRQSGWFVYGLLAATGGALGALGFCRGLLPALGCVGIAGVLLAVINVVVNTLLQRRVPAALQGRVFGLLVGIGSGLMPLAQGLAGVLAATWSAVGVVESAGVALLATGLGFGMRGSRLVSAALEPGAAPAAGA